MTNYVYDGANVVAEYDGTGTAVASYAQGAGVDEPLAIQRGRTTGYYHADGLGSVTSVTSGSGTQLSSYSYGSFGTATSTSETVSNPFRYTGREWDQETGLYYYRARYYDPQAGRFISEDPIRFLAGVNGYDYVHNAPTGFVDPSGLKEKRCCSNQDFSFAKASGRFSGAELEALVQTAVGEAGKKYVAGEIEAIMAAMVNRQNYNLAYANAGSVTHHRYPYPFKGGTSIIGILESGYDAYKFDSGTKKLNGAKGKGPLFEDSYVCQQLEAARAFALTVSNMTADKLITDYPYLYNLGAGLKPGSGAFNIKQFGGTIVYMKTIPW